MEVRGKLSATGNLTNRLVYSWTLQEFSKLTSVAGHSVRSDYFGRKTRRGPGKYYLALSTDEKQDLDERSLGIFLCQGRWMNRRLKSAHVMVFCTFESPKGRTIKQQKSRYVVARQTTNTQNRNRSMFLPSSESRDLNCSVRRDLLLKELQDDILVISVEVTYSVSFVKSADDQMRCVEDVALSLPAVDCLLSSSYEKHGDVVISVQGTDLPAHKFMLSSRSDVFGAMFENDMLEKKNNRIDITDFDEDCVKRMLHFLYTGRVDGMTECLALDLLRAADKYNIIDLKRLCSSYLVSQMGEENFDEIRDAFDMYNVEEAYRKLLNEISMNFKIHDFFQTFFNEICPGPMPRTQTTTRCLQPFNRFDVLCDITELMYEV